MNKIISYLGFAIKSNNCITGQTGLKTTTKQLSLIIVDKTASENLKNLAENLAKKHKCELITSKVQLSELIKNSEVKIVGLTDENLSKAIINNKEIINV
jgi:hypothetical protein